MSKPKEEVSACLWPYSTVSSPSKRIIQYITPAGIEGGTQWKVWKECLLSMTLQSTTLNAKGQRAEESSRVFLSVDLATWIITGSGKEAETANAGKNIKLQVNWTRVLSAAAAAAYGGQQPRLPFSLVFVTWNSRWRAFGMSAKAVGKANSHYLVPRQLWAAWRPAWDPLLMM